MTQHLMPSAGQDDFNPLSLQDQVQIALAVADEPSLKSLLTDCVSPIAPAHRIRSIQTKVSVPLAAPAIEPASRLMAQTIDGILAFEKIHCVLVPSADELKQGIADYTQRYGNDRGYVDLTRCESEMQTLGQSIPLSQALALLTHSGFTPRQIQSILHLPQDGWFQSWWYTVDALGEFTVPFLRVLRTLYYPDGRVTIQYKDFFAKDKPACYMSEPQQVIVMLKQDRSFSETLARINLARQQLSIDRVILVGTHLSELEAKGYINQGVSLYMTRSLHLPTPASCLQCVNLECPLHGRSDPPSALYSRFGRFDI
ncbi:hypothetical protein [Leptolyngbya ohadii]|uniref:hypothetical protein n=1 Tax=Leptolyngbya ohadii TaxID=1962290 RepID=UPI001179E3B8|nr:hypothetical protein [Leptolyngbya ohadii]